MTAAPHERPGRRGHRAGAEVPVSTYRVQLTPAVTFDDAAASLDYLDQLGVTHLYLSPILEAAPGSTHGYDVVDHSRISAALGGEAGLRRLAAAAHERGMGLIADVVPNHMAVPTPAFHNRALWSVLAEGEASPYASWFDVDWSSADGVLMPILGERIGTVLARGELSVDSLVVPGNEEAGPVPVLRYYDHVLPVRTGTEHLPLDALVTAQHYRLAYWRVANEELNYRRFFDVGSLAAVRVEDPDVFDATHRLLVSLVADGTLAGLRIDHPDGLADPEQYLARLAEATDGAWIVVEKILEDEERLPPTWKTAGTTGYDAAWRVGALLRDPAGAAPLAGTLFHLAGDAMGELGGIVHEAKAEMVAESLAAEMRRLTSIAHDVCRDDVRLRDHTWAALHECLAAMVVAFDRYRAYIVPGTAPHPSSLHAIDAAAERARTLLDPERHETLEVVVDLLKGAEVGSAGKQFDAARMHLVTRFQQACGAVMAKGVEDTAYYRWTHLLPLCEVGSPAARFALAPAAFHAWAAEQQRASRHAMTCLTTHDTKRSEDVRARLGVLSEAPDAWDDWVRRVRSATEELRPAELDGRTENLWWQTLVGTVDAGGALMEWERLERYLIKAMREAKSHTRWTRVAEGYESAVLWFAQTTHADAAVRELVAEWSALTEAGVRAAVLAQKLIQLTIPGVADVFQGTEAVRPLLVDPDNRGPVDVAALGSALAAISGRAPTGLFEEKMLVTARALAARRQHAAAFVGDDAGYAPLPASSEHAVVFARTVAGEPRVITMATRAALSLDRLGGWGEHSATLPEGAWRDTLTGRTFAGGSVPLAEVFTTLPVALLVAA